MQPVFSKAGLSVVSFRTEVTHEVRRAQDPFRAKVRRAQDPFRAKVTQETPFRVALHF
jgi:hypothetical protein